MRGQRLYEPIEAELCAMDDKTVSADYIRLGRCTDGEPPRFYLYFRDAVDTNAFRLTEEAARQLRDQLDEALGKPQPAAATLGYRATVPRPERELKGACTCGRPWMSTAPPPPCPRHGPAHEMKVTCEG